MFPVASGILALLAYLVIAWLVLPPEGIWSPDTGAKLLQLQSLRVEAKEGARNGGGRLAYDILYPGREIDPGLQFVQGSRASVFLTVRDGRLYFQRLPLFPLLTLPLFRWFGLYGLYLLPALGGATTEALALHMLRQRDRRFAMWALIALGSPVAIYATLFWEHTLATSLALAAACLALHVSEPGKGSVRSLRRVTPLAWFGAGLLFAASAYTRLETLILALAFLFACWVVALKDRNPGWWGPLLGGGALVLAMLPYRPLHGLLFAGQQMPDNATYIYRPFRYLSSAGWRAIPELLIGPAKDLAIDTGWLGVLWAIAALVAVLCSFVAAESPAVRVTRLAGLAITAAAGAVFLFTSAPYRSAHGLLFTTPWALLGVTRAREVWRRGGRRARVVALSALVGLLGYAVAIVGLRGASPHGGLEWGARFAMTLYPPLALVAAWDLGSRRRDVATLAVVGALTFAGLGLQLRGLWTIGRDKTDNAALNQAIAGTPDQHILTDQWWVPLNAAPIYYQKQIFATDTPEEVARWAELAAAHQVERFSLVTMNPRLASDAVFVSAQPKLAVAETHRVGVFLIFRMEIASF